MNHTHYLGIDVGSTTVKVAILDEDRNILFSEYERHFANIQETLLVLIRHAQEGTLEDYPAVSADSYAYYDVERENDSVLFKKRIELFEFGAENAHECVGAGPQPRPRGGEKLHIASIFAVQGKLRAGAAFHELLE